MTTETKEWRPPFCAIDAEVECPHCGEAAVMVREESSYTDCNVNDAYCAECHTLLEVTSMVSIDFVEPTMASDESDESEPVSETSEP